MRAEEFTPAADRPVWQRLHPAWVSVFAFALYVRTISYDFLSYDDVWLVRDNGLLKHPSLASLRSIWFDFSPTVRFRLGAEYLPVRDLSVMLDHALYGAWAGGHHLTQVLLYTLLCALVASFVDAWFDDRRSAWAASLLFTVHPIHVEAVAWLSERKGLLAGVFVLGSLLCVRAALHGAGTRHWLSACALLMLGVWSKAPTVAAIALLPALLVLRPSLIESGQARRAWRGCLAWSLSGVLAFVPVFLVARVMQVVQPVQAQGLFAKLSLFFAIHAKYWQLLALLKPYNISYRVDESDALECVTGALLLGIALLLGLRAMRRPLLGFAVWWWLALLLPFSQVVFSLQNVMADRYMLLPSLAACLAFAQATGRLARGPRRLLLGGVLLLASATTWIQTGVWRNSEALYENAVLRDPELGMAWNQLANEIAGRGDLKLAVRVVGQGLAHAPGDWHLLHRKALLLDKLGRGDEAIAWLRRAVRVPGAEKAMSNLALALLARGKADEALRWAERAVRSKPLDAHAQRVLGVVQLKQAHLSAATRAFVQALALEPERADNHLNLGLAYLASGDRVRAQAHFQAALALEPRLRESIEGALHEADAAGR